MLVAGHVDHGKSTLTGHLLALSKQVSPREVRGAAKTAAELGKKSFGFAFLLDRAEEEVRHREHYSIAHPGGDDVVGARVAETAGFDDSTAG